MQTKYDWQMSDDNECSYVLDGSFMLLVDHKRGKLSVFRWSLRHRRITDVEFCDDAPSYLGEDNNIEETMRASINRRQIQDGRITCEIAYKTLKTLDSAVFPIPVPINKEEK
jgi:hypothetical protein